MKKICNTRLRVVSQSYSLPKMVTFLEMYGVGSVEQLNPLKRWGEWSSYGTDPISSTDSVDVQTRVVYRNHTKAK